MTKLEAIKIAKQFRKDGDDLLQRMKDHRKSLHEVTEPWADDPNEAIAQHGCSIHDLESCTMRQDKVLHYIG